MTATHSPSSAQSDLLPCPFCGGPVSLENPIGRSNWWGVVCRNTENRGGTCAIEQRPSASKEAAIERWNRRADASAHAIGEDAANVAIGEREAFEVIHEFLGIASKRLYPTPDKPNSDWAKLRAAVDALALIQARAALTAEKVAGQEPVMWVILDRDGDLIARSMTEIKGLNWQPLYTARQQPAQPVAQTLALTDEQREAIEYAVRWMDENVSNRYVHTAAKELRALLAAQPARSLAEGDKQ